MNLLIPVYTQTSCYVDCDVALAFVCLMIYFYKFYLEPLLYDLYFVRPGQYSSYANNFENMASDY